MESPIEQVIEIQDVALPLVLNAKILEKLNTLISSAAKATYALS
jgi:hypothetical protein